MSLETRSTKRNRVYKRKFDHDEARTLYIMENWTLVALAQRYSVTTAAVRRVVDREFREAFDQKSKEFIMSGKCSACGGPTSRYRRGENGSYEKTDGLCRKCSGENKQKRFRFDELGQLAAIRCATCQQWKDAGLFPSNKQVARQKHSQCRQCGTKARQAYRERNKVPCSECGAPCLPVNEKGKTRYQLPRCRACFVEWWRAEMQKPERQQQLREAALRKRKPARPKPIRQNLCPKGHERGPGRKTCATCIALWKSEEAP